MTLTMKQTILLIECLIMLISIVSGEGVTVKLAKVLYLCLHLALRRYRSGIQEITTEEECKAAAEYNSKNKVDNNEGYGIQWSGSTVPRGCVYSNGENKYYF